MQRLNIRRRSALNGQKEAERHSRASRPVQGPSLRRNSDVTPPSSGAGSITSQRSLISQIPEHAPKQPPQRPPPSHFWRKPWRHRHSTAPAPAGRQAGPVPYSDIFARPELKPVLPTSDWGKNPRIRCINLRLRSIEPAEEAEYKTLPFKDGLLADESTEYKAIAGYMLDFDVTRSVGKPVFCTIRLSHCCAGFTARTQLLELLRTMQVKLNSGGCAAVAFPRGIDLDQTYFPNGLAEALPKASQGSLTTDLSVSDPGFFLSKVTISSFNCRMDPSRSYPSSNTKDYVPFSLIAMIPTRSSNEGEPTKKRVRWYQLRGLDEAFPEQLYKTNNETIQKWLGPCPQHRWYGPWAAPQSEYFELRDVERNFAGDILKATLLKVAGPKIDKFLRGINAQQEATETVK